MGATRMGKSCLSIDLATHFQEEIINSDKMQVYKGIEIVTNKITHSEKQGVRHYLLGKFLKTQRIPINFGGSNSYIEKLVEDSVFMFKYKYDTCFTWIDVEQSFLNYRVDIRVDQMVNEDEDDESNKMLLQSSIANIKHNTRLLICHQLDKIQWLINEKMWLVHHIIAIDVFKGDRNEVIDEAWRNTILRPYLDIV
ncbi:hypothetical protein H5410_020918 [Solanum commersonii]|uniref:Isopentenyltransferase n=1 Tax=Solanum commersonii TaxID=4109 RepID=A0A9J5ZB91_SOLCO|nr:hypothetical protein H5410_020918 [Solanum commersonii]